MNSTAFGLCQTAARFEQPRLETTLDHSLDRLPPPPSARGPVLYQTRLSMSVRP